MNINLETAEQHAIQAYGDNKIQINSIIYERSLIVSREEIITDVGIKNIQDLNDEFLNLLINLKPEIIIIGHENTGKLPPFSFISYLSQQRIGIECMSIGAACRTYNVLLSENRKVAVGIIIP